MPSKPPPQPPTFSQVLFKTGKWALIAGFIGDGLIIAGSYYFYRQMTSSTEFRLKVFNYDERFVDAYYRANEKYGNGTARLEDYKIWGINEIKSFKYIKKFGL